MDHHVQSQEVALINIRDLLIDFMRFGRITRQQIHISAILDEFLDALQRPDSVKLKKLSGYYDSQFLEYSFTVFSSRCKITLSNVAQD